MIHCFRQGLELAVIIEEAIARAVKKTNADSDRIQKVISRPEVIFKLIEGLFAEDGKTKKNPSILQLISGGEKLMIEALDGKAYISDAKKTFKLFIDGDFINWGLNQSGPATAETLLDISEIVGDGTFVQIFTGITPDLDKLVMTQAQIIRFCEKHPTWLRQEGYATFFLTKVNGEYFVVDVNVSSDGLRARVHRLGRGNVGLGEYRLRVVVPQLAPNHYLTKSSPDQVLRGALDQLTEDEKNKNNHSVLRLISGGEKLMIEALDGQAYISNAKKTFPSYIDGDFENRVLNQSGWATAEILLDVSELVRDGTFTQIFTGISSDLEKLVMTQAQIIRFCEKYPIWLSREGYAAFFLTKGGGEYFVVGVRMRPDGLFVYVQRFESKEICRGGSHRNVVVPHPSLTVVQKNKS